MDSDDQTWQHSGYTQSNASSEQGVAPGMNYRTTEAQIHHVLPALLLSVNTKIQRTIKLV